MKHQLTLSKTRSLYAFYPLLEDNFFVLKEFFLGNFCPYVWLNSIKERVKMAPVWYSLMHISSEKTIHSAEINDNSYERAACFHLDEAKKMKMTV